MYHGIHFKFYHVPVIVKATNGPRYVVGCRRQVISLDLFVNLCFFASLNCGYVTVESEPDIIVIVWLKKDSIPSSSTNKGGSYNPIPTVHPEESPERHFE